jgi:acetyltransferase
VRLEDAASAEFAIVIADIWQGSGIGSRLLALLLGCARDAGLGRVVGDTLATNTPMLHLARSQGFRIERHPDGAELRRLILDL